jgi:hypothetical protein
VLEGGGVVIDKAEPPLVVSRNMEKFVGSGACCGAGFPANLRGY